MRKPLKTFHVATGMSIVYKITTHSLIMTLSSYQKHILIHQS